LNTLGAWTLALIWFLPLIYAVWTAIHPGAYATRFELFAPLTLENFSNAWNAAPFARYFLNSFLLVTFILIGQFVLCTLAAYAFVRFTFPGRGILFALVLLQLLVMPDILIVENYATMRKLGPLACPISRRALAFSCCARPSRPCPRNWKKPPGSKGPAR
jgi:sn-glycerol 3-phosphate transport system permease protein